ncbi:hypothetical protein GQX73_g2779 [Xylaria multiplex]|uniref:Uncharacterized protein n=1 Tax=Xylaria multiplex TaxID=323545 RepID=A0A7C8IRV9_9PEZI|nr:hypothetical protein GQX73_g2779 [Xylaria multiplex]
MSNPPVRRGLYVPSAYWAAPSRNFRSSTRLHLQHYLWQNTTKFLLEPRIRTSIEQRKQVKIADLGCGNGAWLADLDNELSQKYISAQLNGYDINELNFPPPAFLPGSITLTKLDVLSERLPMEAIGAFDVVHIRAFSSIIINNNTMNLLSTALALLKPGGWIQWEEWGTDLIIEPASPQLSTVSCEKIARVLKVGGDAQGLNVDFVRELDRHLIKAGFQQVFIREDMKRKQDYKGWTEDFLIIWEEVASFFPSRGETPQESVTKESWAQLFADAVKETEQGVALHRGSVFTAIGRKPFHTGQRS